MRNGLQAQRFGRSQLGLLALGHLLLALLVLGLFVWLRSSDAAIGPEFFDGLENDPKLFSTREPGLR